MFQIEKYLKVVTHVSNLGFWNVLKLAFPKIEVPLLGLCARITQRPLQTFGVYSKKNWVIPLNRSQIAYESQGLARQIWTMRSLYLIEI